MSRDNETRGASALERPKIPSYDGISRMIAITIPLPSPRDGLPSTSPDSAQEGARTKRRARAGDAGGVNKGYPTVLGTRAYQMAVM